MFSLSLSLSLPPSARHNKFTGILPITVATLAMVLVANVVLL